MNEVNYKLGTSIHEVENKETFFKMFGRMIGNCYQTNFRSAFPDAVVNERCYLVEYVPDMTKYAVIFDEGNGWWHWDGDYEFHSSSKSTFTEDQLNKLVKTKEFLDKELDFTEPSLIKWRDMEYLYFQFMKVRDLKKLLTKMKKDYGEEYGMSICLFAVKRGFVQSKDLCYPCRKGEEKSVYNLLKAEVNKDYNPLPDYEMKFFTVYEKTDLDKFLEIDIDVNNLTSASEGGKNGN